MITIEDITRNIDEWALFIDYSGKMNPETRKDELLSKLEELQKLIVEKRRKIQNR